MFCCILFCYLNIISREKYFPRSLQWVENVQIQSFSGPYFLIFGMNTEIYGEWSSIFSTNTGKYGPENSLFWHYSCKLTPYFVLCQCIFAHIDLGAIFQKSQIFKKQMFFTILTKINLAGNYFTVSLTFIQRRIHNPAKYIR